MKRLLPLLFFAGCGLRVSTVPPVETLPPVDDVVLETEEYEFKPKVGSDGRIYGYDALGLAMYCDRWLQAPKLPYISTLDNTFGDPLPCLNKGVPIHKLTDVQIDLVDYTCYRNKTCPPGTPAQGDLRVIEQRAKKYRTFKQCYPHINVWLSPGLEHDVKDESKVRGMLNAAARGCPECKVINSPYTGARPAGIPLELHGNKAEAFAVSNDGVSIFDGNSGTYRTNGQKYIAAWFNELNLRFTGEDKPPPPKLRKCKPTGNLFKQAFLVLDVEDPKPGFPRQCQIQRDIKAPEILKTNGESYCNNDSRGNRPLYITKISGRRGSRLDIYTSLWKKIGYFGYYGTYSAAGYHRWYVGEVGSGQTPDQLYDQNGRKEWAFIVRRTGGKTECTRFNTIRRLGTYR